MRLVVVTYGTEGDTRPLAALCRALLDSGHEARLLADRGTLAIAQSLAMPTTPLAGDINGSLQPGGSLSNVITDDYRLQRHGQRAGADRQREHRSRMREVVARQMDATRRAFSIARVTGW